MTLRDTQLEQVRHSLNLDERLAAQCRAWRVQGVARLLVAAVIGLAAIGLFGSGPLSRRHVSHAGITLGYEAFLRFSHESVIRWSLGTTQTVEFLIPVAYLEKVRIERVFPEGYEASVMDGYVTYRFRPDGHADVAVRFIVRPLKAGRVSGSWQVNGHPFRIQHFVYP